MIRSVSKDEKYQKGYVKLISSDGIVFRGWLTGMIDNQGKYEYYREGILTKLFYVTEEELDKMIVDYNPSSAKL